MDDLALINSFMHRYPLRLSVTVGERVENIFAILCKMNLHREKYLQLIHAYLIPAIYEIRQLMDDLHLDRFPSKAFLITWRYYEHLTKHVLEDRDIAFYARMQGITSNHMNKSIKDVTGKTATQLRTEVIIMEAKRQLRQTAKSISEISWGLNFPDLAYFSAFFRKTTGYTPMEYRKMATATG
jgi:AraC-like DNA-binding protein